MGLQWLNTQVEECIIGANIEMIRLLVYGQPMIRMERLRKKKIMISE